MQADRNKLRLGKGTAFVKRRLQELPQDDEVWEADFKALPRLSGEEQEPFLGLVLTKPDGFLLADWQIDQPPSVNDLATLLGHAMRRPLVEFAHRPRAIHVRARTAWQPLLPHLKQVGVEIVIEAELAVFDSAFQEFLEQLRNACPDRALKGPRSHDLQQAQPVEPGRYRHYKGREYVVSMWGRNKVSLGRGGSVRTCRAMKRVLFLCTGNYYRSRFAEIFFNWHAQRSPGLARSQRLTTCQTAASCLAVSARFNGVAGQITSNHYWRFDHAATSYCRRNLELRAATWSLPSIDRFATIDREI